MYTVTYIPTHKHYDHVNKVGSARTEKSSHGVVPNRKFACEATTGCGVRFSVTGF